MITYTDGTKEAIIVSLSNNEWIVNIYESFEAFRNCHEPLETKKFKGTPNRTQMLETWPGWNVRVRNPETWVIIEDSTDDLPLLSSVPANVSARQIRLWLINHGISLTQIENAIQQIQDDLVRQTVQIEWEYAPYIERNHPWLIPLAQSLGLDEEQVDQAFREASQI